jgi:hypothetical protein
MGLLGQGVLAIWNDIAPGGDDEFNHWHVSEHIPERVSIPGFLRGRRYTASRSRDPRYFTLYETESVEVLTSPPYVERLNNPTPWTRQNITLFRNNKRTACRVTATLGRGTGGAMATIELGPAAGRDEELRAWLRGTTLPVLLDRPGIVGAHLCEADLAQTRVQAEEKKLLDQPDAVARWIVMVDAVDPATAEAAATQFLEVEPLTRHGALLDSSLAVFTIIYCLSSKGF